MEESEFYRGFPSEVEYLKSLAEDGIETAGTIADLDEPGSPADFETISSQIERTGVILDDPVGPYPSEPGFLGRLIRLKNRASRREWSQRRTVRLFFLLVKGYHKEAREEARSLAMAQAKSDGQGFGDDLHKALVYAKGHTQDFAKDCQRALADLFPEQEAHLMQNIVLFPESPKAKATREEGKAGSEGNPSSETKPGSLIVSIDEFMHEEPSPAPSLWGDGVIAEGSNNALAGDEGVAKTALLVALALHLAAGRDFLGLSIPKARRILFLEAEGNRDYFRTRVEMAAQSYGIKWQGLPISFGKKATEFSLDQNETVNVAAIQSRAEFTILDTVGLFHDGEENSNTDWKRRVIKPAQRITRATGTAWGFVTHFGKPAENRTGANRIRGAGAIKGDCDTLMTLEPASGGETRRLLKFPKIKNGPPLNPMVLAFNGPRAQFDLLDIVGSVASDADTPTAQFRPPRDRKAEIEERVLKVLAANPGISQSQIFREKKVKGRKADVLDAIRDLISAGRVKSENGSLEIA